MNYENNSHIQETTMTSRRLYYFCGAAPGIYFIQISLDINPVAVCRRM